MSLKKSRRRRLHPFRFIWNHVVFLVYDVLHALNLVGDGIAPPVDPRADSKRDVPGHRRYFYLLRILATPILAPLSALGRLMSRLMAMLRLSSLAALPAAVGNAISLRCHEFLYSLGLLDDAIDGASGPRRRLLAAARFAVGFVVRVVPWLRAAAFFLLSEVLYHLGLINDSVDAQRVWTRTMTLSVLPALLCLIAATGIGIQIASTSQTEVILQYATVAQAALEAEDHERAALWLTRLLKLDPRQAVYRYELAVTLDTQGHHARAWALMEQLGPPDRPGFPPAHLWLAKRLCDGPTATVGQLQAAWRHLSRVLRAHPDSDEVHQLLARVLISLGQLADAEKHLQQSAENDPEMRLLLAAVYARQGKLDLAGHEAHLADEGLSKQLSSKPVQSELAQSVQLRLRLADAKVLAGDFAGAEQVLSQIEADEPAAAKVRLSQLYLAWYDALTRAGGSLAERSALLERALEAVPWNLPSLKRLLELAKRSPAEATWAAGLLDKLDWQTATPEALLVVGLDEWKSGERASAAEHLEAAYRANPRDIRAANNLAWILAHSEPPDFERALELINQAVTQAPGQPNLLDTRGRIFFKLRRWSDALGDFESLAAARPQDKQLHEILADCYGKLGMEELADFQRKLASNTSSPSDAKKTSGSMVQP